MTILRRPSSPLISCIRVFWFSPCSCVIHFVRFNPKYLVLGVEVQCKWYCVLNLKLHLFPDGVQSSTDSVYELCILQPCYNCLFVPPVFCWFLQIFYVVYPVICKKESSFSFFSFLPYFYFISCLIVLARICCNGVARRHILALLLLLAGKLPVNDH